MSFNEFPARFGKYILLDRINAGGMAEVFRAKVTGVEGFERLVAIKCMLPALLSDEQFSNMFIDEARLAAQVGHANVAQIYELGRHAERLYIAMELVSGRDLRHIIKTATTTGRLLPPQFAAYICSKAAEGLDFAHRKAGSDGTPLGLVHRDISPQNILVSYDGEVKVVDFGIAKANSAARDTQTQVGVLKGKFAYMSPEQVLGQDIDRRADIFALGSVLYEMVTGNRLFTGESDLTVLERVRGGVLPDFNIVLPADAMRLVPVFEKALTVDPEQRFLWASEFAEALEPMLMGERSIFGPKRAAALMRELYASEVLELAEKLKKFAGINEQNCVVVIGESDTSPGGNRQVFESTFASRKQGGQRALDEQADTGVVPRARLEAAPKGQIAEADIEKTSQADALAEPLAAAGAAEPTSRTLPQEASATVPQPLRRAPAVVLPNVARGGSSAQQRIVVPKPAERTELARPVATEILRPVGMLQPGSPPAAPAQSHAQAASQPHRPLFEPAASPAAGRPPASARAASSVAPRVTHTQVSPRPQRAHTQASAMPATVRTVLRRLKVAMGVTFAITGTLVLIVNASMPTPMTLEGALQEVRDLRPLERATDVWGRLRASRPLARLPLVGGAGSDARDAVVHAASHLTPTGGPADAGPVGGAKAAPIADEGYLRVTVLGAEIAHVSVDEQDLGLAPTPLVRLKAGAHTVRVERQRSDGTVEHREGRVRVSNKNGEHDPLGITLAF